MTLILYTPLKGSGKNVVHDNTVIRPRRIQCQQKNGGQYITPQEVSYRTVLRSLDINTSRGLQSSIVYKTNMTVVFGTEVLLESTLRVLLC